MLPRGSQRSMSRKSSLTGKVLGRCHLLYVACDCGPCAGLPIKDKLEGLLAETLFSQLLCLPRPRHKALAYSTIMVRSCSDHRELFIGDQLLPADSSVRSGVSVWTSLIDHGHPAGLRPASLPFTCLVPGHTIV